MSRTMAALILVGAASLAGCDGTEATDLGEAPGVATTHPVPVDPARPHMEMRCASL